MQQTEQRQPLPVMSSPNYESTFLPQVFHYTEEITDDSLLQIQRSAVHTANLARVISLFQESVVAFTEEEETAKRGVVFCHSIQAFRWDTQAGDGMLNILDSPPRPI